MPSASTKSDIKPPVDPTEGVKQILNIVDKKIRNLEKRKGKLDVIREKRDSGKELNPDQVEAVSRYDQVLQNLDLSREFQKQFTDQLAVTEKLWKKQQKREKMERAQEEQRRVHEVLTVQNVLDSMGGETAREDFSKGHHGAVQLSEDNLNQLDELYKLISPTRDDEESPFKEQLVSSSEHFCNLLEGKEKDVIGTTYKELKNVVDKIVACGYLDRPRTEEGGEETLVVETEEVAAPPQHEQQVAEITENGQIEEEVPGTVEFGGSEEAEMIEPEPTEMPTLHTEVLTPEAQPEDQLEAALGGGNTESEVVDDAFFSTAFHNKQRPFNEIVSSVQGNFNFLQDSQIDLETSRSPHMDPAVVAAHPMPQSLSHHQTDSSLTQGLTSQTYQSSTYVTGDKETDSQKSSQQSSHVTSQTGAPSLVNQSELDNTYSQNYASHLSHSLQDSSLHSMVNQSSDLTSHGSQSASTIGQTSHAPNTETSVLPPQPIPMPNQTSLGQTPSQQELANQEKKFSMNANAAVFHSIYSQQTGTYQPGQDTTADGSNQQDKDDNTQRGQNDYQSSYNNYGRMNNNNRGGRGSRGGDRGGRGGSMSNGYNSRGGNNNSRGGAPFSNRSMSGSSGFNGGGRSGNNRAMRGSGGPPRGGNNTWRGGRGGNNGKANMGYQSQGQTNMV
ncbi:caprin-1-like isoform X2 [Lineus longissimus]|uniref:caprin-1-like isoform X2 n=1 Tax=Lineus longissimus TaxID=88925 RepID=UPI00315CDDB3